jgi:hypothetical protein
MAAFDRTIELAKRQLPRAFTIGGGLPYSGGGDPRRLPERLDNLEEGAFANAVGSTIPAGTEEAGTEDGPSWWRRDRCALTGSWRPWKYPLPVLRLE